MDKSECGKLGAISFWIRFRKDDKLRDKMKLAWEHPKKDSLKAKNAAINAAKIRWKNHNKKEVDAPENIEIIYPSKIPSNFPLIARLCGYISGDGSICVRKEFNKTTTHYDISFYPDHESLIFPFVDAFKRLYAKTPSIKRLNNFYTVRVCSKLASEDLLSITSFKSKEWIVPSKLLDSDSSKIEWIKAYFDSESYVSKNNICVQSVNKEGLYQVKELLNYFGINSKIYEYKRKQKQWSTNYLLFISERNSREAYLNKIGFNHKVKLAKLKSQLSQGSRIRLMGSSRKSFFQKENFENEN